MTVCYQYVGSRSCRKAYAHFLKTQCTLVLPCCSAEYCSYKSRRHLLYPTAGTRSRHSLEMFSQITLSILSFYTLSSFGYSIPRSNTFITLPVVKALNLTGAGQLVESDRVRAKSFLSPVNHVSSRQAGSNVPATVSQATGYFVTVCDVMCFMYQKTTERLKDWCWKPPNRLCAYREHLNTMFLTHSSARQCLSGHWKLEHMGWCTNPLSTY